MEKRYLFFYGFHSPDFCLEVSFLSLGLFNRQSVFVDDGKTVERGFPGRKLSRLDVWVEITVFANAAEEL